jgi:uncharacterized protein
LLGLGGGWPTFGILFLAGAAASGINAVAGGGTLISFPVLTALGMHANLANATNAVALWPGSLGGAIGFRNLLPKAGHHFKTLLLPTIVGAALGSMLFVATGRRLFDIAVPFLILFATLLLLFQPQVKRWALGGRKAAPIWAGLAIQFLVAVYGGYFGAGMGIMMLGAFALYMEGSIHELNAIKVWLGLFINLVASVVFLAQGMVVFGPAIALTLGSIVGGFLAAKYSQRLNPEKLRIGIVAYGFLMVVHFALRAFGADPS